MRVDPPLEQSSVKRDSARIAVLLAIGSAIGIYLIVTAVVISQDGVTFVKFAQNLAVSPTETMMQEAQHPGYPYLILAARSMTQIVSEKATPALWVYSAQAVALIFKLLTMVMIYLLGKVLVGPKPAFLAALLLTLLPVPARYGSDALSDWPAMFFMITSLLLLLQGATKRKSFLFGLAGVSAGAGYLVRPECSQMIVYGLLWLILNLSLPKQRMSRPKTVLAIAVLLVGFGVLAAPYMHLKGALFPKKALGEFAANVNLPDEHNSSLQRASLVTYKADIASREIAGGALQIFDNMGETVMWFFLPALVVGLCDYFKRLSDLRRDPRRFLVLALLLSNSMLLIWLYAKHGYMGKRHTLLMVVISAFYIQSGLKILATLLCGIIRPEKKASDESRDISYFAMLAVGISVCIPKLLKPLHYDKLFIPRASQWLAANTEPQDLVAAHDSRIAFYSGRKRISFDGRSIPAEARYVVIRKGGRDTIDEKLLRLAASIEDDKGNPIATIYSRFD